jgi:hypothetical protein
MLVILAACLTAGALLPRRTTAQVTVAPVGLFLEDDNPFGTLNVANGSDAAQEVEVGFRFGYPTTDSLGNVYMEYEDSTAAERYSAAPYVRAFPKQFVLPSGQSQVVRITAQVPPDLEEGYYWTRVVTTAMPQSEFRDTTDEGVRARVQFRLQQVTSLLYKKGSPVAAVDINELSATADSGQVVVSARIERGGGAPFLGSAIVQVRNEEGEVVQKMNQSLAAYFSLYRRFQIPLPDEADTGTYSATLRLTPERSDIPAQDRIEMTPVSASTEFSVE